MSSGDAEILTRPAAAEYGWQDSTAEDHLSDFSLLLRGLRNDALVGLFDVSPFRTARVMQILHTHQGTSDRVLYLTPWDFATLLKRIRLLDANTLPGEIKCPDAADAERWMFYRWCKMRREQDKLQIDKYPTPPIPTRVVPAAQALDPVFGAGVVERGKNAQQAALAVSKLVVLPGGGGSSSSSQKMMNYERILDYYWQVKGAERDERTKEVVRLVYSLWVTFVEPFLAPRERLLLMLPPWRMHEVLRYVCLRGLMLADDTHLVDQMKEDAAEEKKDAQEMVVLAADADSGSPYGFLVIDYSADSIYERRIMDEPPENRKSSTMSNRKSVGHLETQIHHHDYHDFFFTPQRMHSEAPVKSRWIALSLGGGGAGTTEVASELLGKANLLRLAVKYRIHPLAIEDALSLHDQAPSGRVTRYDNKLEDLIKDVGYAVDADGAPLGNDDDNTAPVLNIEELKRGAASSRAIRKSVKHAEVAPLFPPEDDVVATQDGRGGKSDGAEPAAVSKEERQDNATGEHWYLSVPLFRLSDDTRHRMHALCEELQDLHGGAGTKSPAEAVRRHTQANGHRAAVQRNPSTVESVKSFTKNLVTAAGAGIGNNKDDIEVKTKTAGNARPGWRMGIQANLGIEVESAKLGVVLGVRPKADFCLSVSTPWHKTRVNMVDDHVKRASEAAREQAQQEYESSLAVVSGDVPSPEAGLPPRPPKGMKGMKAKGGPREGLTHNEVAEMRTLLMGDMTDEETDSDAEDEEAEAEAEKRAAAMEAKKKGARQRTAAGKAKKNREAASALSGDEEDEDDAAGATTNKSRKKTSGGGAAGSKKDRPRMIQALRRVKRTLFKDYSVIRHGDAIWLLYCILDKALDECLPIAHAFELQLAITASRLHEHEHALPIQEIKNLYLVERHLDWLTSEMKPFQRVLKALIEQNFEDRIPNEVRGYIEDIQNSLEEMLDRLGVYGRECASLKEERQSYVDNSLNRLITVLTIITTAALPATVFSGYAGMNFETEDGGLQDEWVNWEHGWKSYLVITSLFTVLLVIYVMSASKGLPMLSWRSQTP